MACSPMACPGSQPHTRSYQLRPQSTELLPTTPGGFSIGRATPREWQNGYGSLPQDQAVEAMETGFDFFGSNAAMLRCDDADSDAASGPASPAESGEESGESDGADSSEVDDAWGSESEGNSPPPPSPATLAETVQQQAERIVSLEENNLDLREVRPAVSLPSRAPSGLCYACMQLCSAR